MKKVLIAALVLLVAGLTWFALHEDARAPAAVPSGLEGTAETEVPAPARADATLEPATEPTPAERSEVEPTAATSALTVTLKGRCVDAATGAPLAGCEIKVQGYRANSERMDAYLEDHAPVEWTDPPPQTTGPDGLFAFTFVPPPPYQFSLGIGASERVRASCRWDALEPGTVKDFGDIALVRGSGVSGRIDDSHGVSQDGVDVIIDQLERLPDDFFRRDEHVAPRRHYQTRSRADGTFAFEQPVPAGRWNLRLRGRQKVAPESLEIPEGQTFTTLLIETVPLGELETITGVVVNDTGAPVHRVHVDYTPKRSGQGWIISTKSDGTFVVERRDGDPDGPVQLTFDREGFEYLTSEKRYAWGTKDLSFVMKRGQSVDITVVDGDTGEPIEDYAVRCFPEPGSRQRRSSLDFEVKSRGHHPAGQTTLVGIARGPNVLVVEPAGDSWPTSEFVPFDMTDAGAPVQRVELFRRVSQTLRVQRSTGEPVTGSAVELLRPGGAAPVTVATRGVPLSDLINYHGPDNAVVLMKGETNADGELLLRGPPRAVLALRLLGPGHQPQCEPAVTLVEGEPLVVTVPTGATVFGKIGPAEFLDSVRRADPRFGPRLVFWREQQGQREQFPGSGTFDGIRVSEDGTYRATGLPPGTWSAHLTYLVQLGGGSSTNQSVFLQDVVGLTDGEERELNADLAHLVPGTVSGTVIMNGQPLAHGTIRLAGRRPDGRGGQQQVFVAAVKTGVDGAFATAAEPATYRLMVQMPPGANGMVDGLPAVEELTLAPGQELEQAFHVRSGALRLRVLRSDGQPVAGIEVSAISADQPWATQTPKTDSDGWTTIEAGPLGTVVLTAMPKRLLDLKARQEFWRTNQNAADAWRNAQLQLGRAEIKAGTEPSVVEVRLPASSEY